MCIRHQHHLSSIQPDHCQPQEQGWFPESGFLSNVYQVVQQVHGWCGLSRYEEEALQLQQALQEMVVQGILLSFGRLHGQQPHNPVRNTERWHYLPQVVLHRGRSLTFKFIYIKETSSPSIRLCTSIYLLLQAALSIQGGQSRAMPNLQPDEGEKTFSGAHPAQRISSIYVLLHALNCIIQRANSAKTAIISLISTTIPQEQPFC